MLRHIVWPDDLVDVARGISPEALERDVAVSSLTTGFGLLVRSTEEDFDVEMGLDGGHGGGVEEEAV